MNKYKPDNQERAEESKGVDLTKSPREFLNKIFKKNNTEDDKPKTITCDMKKPHSIIDEVFSWNKKS